MTDWKIILKKCLFLTLILLCVSKAIFADANIIVGGDFEGMTVGTVLSNPNNATQVFYAGNATAVVSDAYAKTGSKSAKVSHNGSSNEAALNYLVSLTVGETYRITAWVRFDEAFKGEGNIYIRLAGFGNIYYDKRGISEQISGDSDFVKIETTVTLVSGYDYSKSRINISSNVASGESFYVDDVTCVKVSDEGGGEEPPPDDEEPPVDDEPINLVANGDFEDFSEGEAIPIGGSVNVGEYMATGVSEATITTEYAKSGSKSIKIVHDGSDNYPVLNHFLPLKAGKSYYFSAWVRFDPSYEGSSGFYIRMSDTSFAWEDRGEVTGLRGSDDFVKVSAIYTADKDYGKARLNIMVNTRNSVIAYIDDISCVEIPEVNFLTKTEWNQLGQQDSISICPTNVEIIMTFNSPVDPETIDEGGLLLNGNNINTDQISISINPNNKKEVIIQLTDLNYAKYYTLSFNNGGSEKAWKDPYDRVIDIEPLIFKTANKVYVASKKLYCNGVEITDGSLSEGIIRGEIKDIYNLSGNPSNLSCILVLLKDGEIVKSSCSTQMIPANGAGSTVITSEILVDSIDDGSYQLKLYVWDDLLSAITFSEEVTLQ